MGLGTNFSVCPCCMGVLFIGFYLLSSFFLYVAYG